MLTTGKPKYSDINVSHCHFAHQNSYRDWPEIEPVSPRRGFRLTAYLYYNVLFVYHSLGQYSCTYTNMQYCVRERVWNIEVIPYRNSFVNTRCLINKSWDLIVTLRASNSRKQFRRLHEVAATFLILGKVEFCNQIAGRNTQLHFS